jgi:hypothetical protein
MSVWEHGIAAVFIRSLQKKQNNQQKWTLFEMIDEFLTDLNQNIMVGMNNQKYIDVKEILEHVYMIGIVFISITKRIEEKRLKEEGLKILKVGFSYPFTNAISMSFKNNRKYHIFYDAYMHSFFSLAGIAFYENSGNIFNEIIEDWVSKIIEIIRRNKTNLVVIHEEQKFPRYEIIHPLKNLYRYLRLAGIWFNEYCPKSNLLKEIILEIKNQPLETISIGIRGSEYLYPKDSIIDRWIVQRPYLSFDTSYFSSADIFLYNDQIKQKFESKLK